MVKTTYYNAILGVLKIKAPKLHAHLILLTTGFGGEVAGWLELLVGTLCTAAFVGPTSTWVPPTPRRRTAEARGRSPVAEPSPALTGEPVPDLQMEKLVRLWDVLLFEGENAVIRGAVARLMECEEAIAKCERGWEVRDALLGRGLEVVDEEEEEEEERREAEAERRASSRVRSATIVREKDVEDWMELVKEAGKV